MFRDGGIGESAEDQRWTNIIEYQSRYGRRLACSNDTPFESSQSHDSATLRPHSYYVISVVNRARKATTVFAQ